MNRAAWFRAGFLSWVAGSALALATASSADDGWVTLPYTPFQLAIVPGYGQVFTKATPVYGLRISVLYGVQSKVVGLDAGLFNVADSLTGVGVGLCNVTEGNAAGAHLGLGCSHVDADFAGFQTGFVNQVGGQLKGFQLGFANSAEAGAGLQMGLVNHSDSMRGVQLGLLNWNDNGFLPFFPFVNFGF
jgi:hypothetical protein